MSVQKINPEFTCQRWYLSDCQSWTNKCKTRHSERKVVSLDCYRLLSTSSEQISTPTGSASVAPGAHTAGEMVTSVGGSCDGSPPQGNGTLSNRWCDHEESLWPSCSSCPTSSSKSNIMWDSGCPQQDHSPPVRLSNIFLCISLPLWSTLSAALQINLSYQEIHSSALCSQTTGIIPQGRNALRAKVL